MSGNLRGTEGVVGTERVSGRKGGGGGGGGRGGMRGAGTEDLCVGGVGFKGSPSLSVAGSMSFDLAKYITAGVPLSVSTGDSSTQFSTPFFFIRQ